MRNNFIKHFFGLVLEGLFAILPLAVLMIIGIWLFHKIDLLVVFILESFQINPQNHPVLWFFVVIGLLALGLYFMGHLVQTKLANLMEYLLEKIPFYSTIKDIISIFNSSKKGDRKVLVVVIKGFATEGFNIGLMYSKKESILKDHYTITLAQTPLPNGGYMFEVHKNNIYVLEEATFDHNLQYLLSMGVKSLAEIMKTEPKNIDELLTIEQWFELNNTKK